MRKLNERGAWNLLRHCLYLFVLFQQLESLRSRKMALLSGLVESLNERLQRRP